jgi:hypothetical protein
MFLTVGRSAGYWITAGLGLAFGLTVWAIRAKRRGFFVVIRFATVVLGVATIWFLGVDESEFVEGCPDCNSRTFIRQYRLCGAPISTDSRALRTTIDRHSKI